MSSLQVNGDSRNALQASLPETLASASGRVAGLAARVMDTPMSAMSVGENGAQQVVSSVGLSPEEQPNVQPLCDRVAEAAQPVIIPNAAQDADLAGTPLVGEQGVRFCAGAPLLDDAGHAAGTLCVMDTAPRHAPLPDMASLTDLAALAASQIGMHAALRAQGTITGLPSRGEFLKLLAASAEAGEPALIAVVNLADTVRLTDLLSVLGPHQHDDLIRAGALAIENALPPGVALHQVGTARFAFMLPGVDGEHDAAVHEAVLDGLAQAMRAPVQCGLVPVFLDVAIGAAPFHPGHDTPANALRVALCTAQRSRDEGQAGRWTLHNSGADRAHRRAFQLLTDLRPALELVRPPSAPATTVADALADGLLPASNQLSLHYQPRIDLRSGQCRSVEALLRWQHPTLGCIPPGEFIPLVEKTALPHAMTAWVLDTALSDMARWRRAGLHMAVSVNVCVLNLSEPGFADSVAAALKRHNLPPDVLELELTESALLRGEHLVRTMRNIAALGVTLSIDDFGTGYSNLAYLRSIPARVLKLDRCFIRTLPSLERDRTIVRSLIDLAHDLHYRVVAEGVECENTLDLLRTWQCDEVQGFLFSRAMPAEALPQWVMAQRSTHLAA